MKLDRPNETVFTDGLRSRLDKAVSSVLRMVQGLSQDETRLMDCLSADPAAWRDPGRGGRRLRERLEKGLSPREVLCVLGFIEPPQDKNEERETLLFLRRCYEGYAFRYPPPASRPRSSNLARSFRRLREQGVIRKRNGRYVLDDAGLLPHFKESILGTVLSMRGSNSISDGAFTFIQPGDDAKDLRRMSEEMREKVQPPLLEMWDKYTAKQDEAYRKALRAEMERWQREDGRDGQALASRMERVRCERPAFPLMIVDLNSVFRLSPEVRRAMIEDLEPHDG